MLQMFNDTVSASVSCSEHSSDTAADRSDTGGENIVTSFLDCVSMSLPLLSQ